MDQTSIVSEKKEVTLPYILHTSSFWVKFDLFITPSKRGRDIGLALSICLFDFIKLILNGVVIHMKFHQDVTCYEGVSSL